jgi:hypothetical protein
MAWVKLAGVGADLPVLQPEAKVTKARAVAVSRDNTGFL